MNKKKSATYRGRCLCGAVRYEVAGLPLVVAHCHCEKCQRGSGAGHSTGAMFPADKYLLSGPVAEYKYTADNGNEVTKIFCPACGSPVLGRNSGTPDYLTIPLGTIDDGAEFKPQVVIFARNRKHWDIMDDSIPTFEAQPNWRPGDDV